MLSFVEEQTWSALLLLHFVNIVWYKFYLRSQALDPFKQAEKGMGLG